VKPIREAALLVGVNLPGESGQLSIDTNNGAYGNNNNRKKNDETTSGWEMEAAERKAYQEKGKQLAKQRQDVFGKTGKELKQLRTKLHDSSIALFPSGHPIDEVILVGGVSRMPMIQTLLQTMTRLPVKHSFISPDETVCLGAGVLAGMCDGTIQGMQVMSPIQAGFVRFVAEQKAKGVDIMAIFQQGSETAARNNNSNNNSSVSEKEEEVVSTKEKRLMNRLVEKRRKTSLGSVVFGNGEEEHAQQQHEKQDHPPQQPQQTSTSPVESSTTSSPFLSKPKSSILTNKRKR